MLSLFLNNIPTGMRSSWSPSNAADGKGKASLQEGDDIALWNFPYMHVPIKKPSELLMIMLLDNVPAKESRICALRLFGNAVSF